MTNNRIMYILLVVCAFLFWVMYHGELSLQLLMVSIAIPLLLFLLLLWQRATLTVHIEPTADAATAGERFQILLHITSRCPIPIHYTAIALQYAHSIVEEDGALYVHLPGMGRAQQTVRLPFSASCCGTIRFQGAEIRIYDPLSLFSLCLPCKDAFSLLILPQTDVLAAMPPLPDMIAAEQSETFSKQRGGDDPSEIFSVDAYAQGDALSHVHWKLTAKSDEMMIKHFSLSEPDSIILFADYTRCGSDVKSAMRLHHVLSVCASMSQHLLGEEIPHRLWWQPTDTADDVSFPIDSPDALLLSLREMLSTKPFAGKTPAIQGTEFPAAARLIYCTASLDEETVLYLSALSLQCSVLVLYVCNAQPENLPQDVCFVCYPVICSDEDAAEVMQHG